MFETVHVLTILLCLISQACNRNYNQKHFYIPRLSSRRRQEEKNTKENIVKQ